MPEAPSRQDEQDEERTMRIERTERADGRYLMYYSWPGPPRTGAAQTASDEHAEAHPDV